MATYHFTMKTGGKGAAAAHAGYIAREGKYRVKSDIEYVENGNLPQWAADPAVFWEAADAHERENGTTYREIEAALPRELDPDQRRALVQRFVDEHIGDDHTYTLAIHNPKAAIEGGEQPHFHLQFSERKLDEIERDRERFFKRANKSEPERGGCAKSERWNGKDRAAHLETLRESWETHVNSAYELAGHPERVSCRSLEARGIEREPERHLGPKIIRDGNAVDLVKELRQYQRELALIEWERADLAAELERERITSPSASPAAKVPTPPLPQNSFSPQQPVFDSYEEAVQYRDAYIQARHGVIEEFYRKPLERRQAENLIEVELARKELDAATKERERIEGNWGNWLFKRGLAESMQKEKEAKEAFGEADKERRQLDARLQQRYPAEWVRENAAVLEREIGKRLEPDSGERYRKALEITKKHELQQAQQRELERQVSKGRKGPGLGR